MHENIPDLPLHPPKKPSRGFDHLDCIGALLGTAVSGGFVLISWKAAQNAGRDASFYTDILFIFVPLLAGFVSGVVSNWKTTKSIGTSWLNVVLLFVVSCTALMAFGIEGVICIAMAMPLVMPIIALGLFFARMMMAWIRSGPRILASAAPVLLAAGFAAPYYNPGFETKTETTTIIVDAPPEKIWPHLFYLDNLPEPDQWIFKTGIAYTRGTRASGRQVGDSRQCILTTGVMNERIAAIEENRYMRFEVLNTPPSMKEMNPFYDIHPRHENGCFKVHWGEFRLEPLPGGKTRFTGTSSYSYNIYPAWYWGLWTDTVAEQIHVRMMTEIKRRLEART